MKLCGELHTKLNKNELNLSVLTQIRYSLIKKCYIYDRLTTPYIYENTNTASMPC